MLKEVVLSPVAAARGLSAGSPDGLHQCLLNGCNQGYGVGVWVFFEFEKSEPELVHVKIGVHTPTPGIFLNVMETFFK